MKVLAKTLLPFALVIAAVIVFARFDSIVKWVFDTGGVDPKQEHTIDSLIVANDSLDTRLDESLRQQDSLRTAMRLKWKADSVARFRSIDSLKALIPDTGEMVPRVIAEAIIAQQSVVIVELRFQVVTLDSLLTARNHDLSELRRQNAALLGQVNDLRKKANPGIIRRAKIALPFVGGVFGACKLDLIDCS